MRDSAAGFEDELFTPTVTTRPLNGQLPWRLGSQFWVAFFGGVLALTVIAWLNAQRLNVPARRRRWIPVVALAGLSIVGAFWMMRPLEPTYTAWSSGGSDIRLYSRIVAAVAYLAMARVQRPEDSGHTFFGSGEYASLWKAGIAAVIIAGAIQRYLITGLVWWLR